VLCNWRTDGERQGYLTVTVLYRRLNKANRKVSLGGPVAIYL